MPKLNILTLGERPNRWHDLVHSLHVFQPVAELQLSRHVRQCHSLRVDFNISQKTTRCLAMTIFNGYQDAAGRPSRASAPPLKLDYAVGQNVA
jgi:hypothetical protein